MKKIDQMTKTEKTLLLIMECASVDNGGIYKPERTTPEDREIMDRWKSEGFIDHGRVASEYLTEWRHVWVKLSPEAMTLAHQVRIERAERLWNARTWKTTEEKRAS